MLTTIAHSILGTVTIETLISTSGVRVCIAQASRFPEELCVGFTPEEAIAAILAYTEQPA